MDTNIMNGYKYKLMKHKQNTYQFNKYNVFIFKLNIYIYIYIYIDIKRNLNIIYIKNYIH